MRWTRSLIPTLRDDPADAEAISHKLMVRAGLVRQLAAGIYVYLPLGLRVIEKVNAIIREEMNGIGGQEIEMPVLQPAELWQQSGRWDVIGGEMFRLKDRNGRDMCLGMTHEEVIAWLAAREIRSYRDLPQIWYQIQTKERDEARPRSGVLRTREFLMKDSYTLDPDTAALEISYNAHKDAYCRIFDRCGITYVVVQSDPGMMGGSGSHEFMAPSAAGEDDVALCDACGYAANVELARGVPSAPPAGTPPGRKRWPRRAHAPSRRSRLSSRSIRPPPSSRWSSWGPTARCWRWCGATTRSTSASSPARSRRKPGPRTRRRSSSISAWPRARSGRSGVRGARIIADESLREGRYVVGANREGFHLTGVTPGQDFACEWADLQVALAGEGCPTCGKPLRIERVIEVGNIFKLGTRYSVPLGATYLDERGQQQPIVMGSYGIGPARIAAAAVEQRHDQDGIVWPWAIAPFHVHLVPVAVKDAAQMAAAEEIYRDLRAAGVDVLMDDREERAGVKFKDADLLGIPIRVTVGNALAKEGVVELRQRSTRTDRRVPKAEVVAAVREMAQTIS